MSLINCEINLMLTWSANYVIDTGMTDAKLYVPVVTLSNQDNTKLLQQFESRFKQTINWNKYQSKVTTQNKISIWIK